MEKVLIIAEKPSVARDIARVLKCKNKKENYFFSDEYIVSFAIGHLVTLYDPEDYDKNLKKWTFNTLPIKPNIIKLKAIKSTKSQFDLLKKLMNSKDISYIICATDSGREGELIFRYIYNLANCKKPFKRLWISSMTDKAIKEGFENLKEGSFYDNLYISAKCRSLADWLVGINATRAYTLKYNTLLSIGRVQTPTLSILVKRQKEIENFTPSDYFEVIAIFENYEGMWINLETKETKIKEELIAKEIKQSIKNKKGIIYSIENEKKQKSPPLLYNLTQLQRDCNKKFGYTSKKTLTIAQDLYEKRKLITYPRTDSEYLSDDMIDKIHSTLKKLELTKYKEYISYIRSLPKLNINKRIIDNKKVTDHHAIIPTDVNIKLDILSKDEFNVYDLIVRRFISVFYKSNIYLATKIITQIDNYFFITKINKILEPGFTVLYKDTETIKEDNISDDFLLKLSKNDIFDVIDQKLLKKKTKPPSFYTEASLLSVMENCAKFTEDETLKEKLKELGIGTVATRASIIERLINVGYLKRNKKNLIPTEKGIKLIEILPYELISPETTGKWEKGLSSISKGKMKEEKFMQSINNYVDYIIDTSKTSSSDVIFNKD